LTICYQNFSLNFQYLGFIVQFYLQFQAVILQLIASTIWVWNYLCNLPWDWTIFELFPVSKAKTKTLSHAEIFLQSDLSLMIRNEFLTFLIPENHHLIMILIYFISLTVPKPFHFKFTFLSKSTDFRII